MYTNKILTIFILFLSFYANCQTEEIIFPIKHSSTLTSLKYSHNKKLIATASNDCTIKLWLTTQNVLIKTLSSHTQAVNCIDFSANDSLIASGSNDSTLIIWNILANNIKFKIPINDKITTLSFNKNNNLIVGTENGKILLVNITTGKIENVYTIINYKATKLSFIKDYQKFIVTTSKHKNDNETKNTGSIYLFDLNNFQKPIAISNYNEDINDICFSNDSEKFVTSANNGMVRVWNSKEFIEEISFKNNNLTPGFIFMSPNKKMIAVASQKTNKINIWRITGEKLFDFTIKNGKIIYGEFNKESTELNICNNFGSYVIYDLDARTGDNLGDFLQNQSNLTSFAFSKSSNYLAIGFGNGAIRGFNLTTSTPLKYTTTQSTKILSMAFSNDDKRLLVSNDQIILSYDYSDKIDVGSSFLTFIETNTSNIKNIVTNNSEYSTSLSSTLNYSISGLNSGILKFYQNENAKEISQFKLHDYDILDINISTDNKSLITCSTDATAKTWKIEGAKLLLLKNYQFNNEVLNAYYIPINQTVIANVKGEGIHLLNKNWKYLIHEKNDATDIDVNENDSIIYASYNLNKTKCIAYSLNNGNKLWEYNNIGSKIIKISYSHKYNLLFCSLEDGSIILIDSKTGKRIATLIIFENLNWLIYTPENLFDATEAVVKKTNVINNFNILPSENISKYYKKGILANLLSK